MHILRIIYFFIVYRYFLAMHMYVYVFGGNPICNFVCDPHATCNLSICMQPPAGGALFSQLFSFSTGIRMFEHLV